VISRTRTEGTSGVTFYHGDIETLVNDLRAEPGKDIYCDGGAQIVQLMMQKDLIDEFIISVIPIILGDGKRLFLGSTPRSGLQALPPRSYPSGLVQLHYIRINDVS
jgi:dihydrofolate reductase